MKRLSSPSLPPLQTVRRAIENAVPMLKSWKAICLLSVAALFLIFTGLIILFIPMFLFLGGFFLSLVYSYEIRFTKPASGVWDHGDALEIERNGLRQMIPLSQFRSIRLSMMNTPPHSVLELHQPCRWGWRITWFPDTSKSRDAAKAIVADLQHRIAAAQLSTPPVNA